MNWLAKLGVIACALFICLIAFLMFGPFYSVDQGEEAVVLRNGAIIGTSGPGLHFKTPFIDRIETISLQMRSASFGADANAPMESYTHDQQPADIVASVNFHVPPGDSSQVYSEYGSIDAMVGRLLARKFPAILKDVFGQYDAQTVIQQRAKFNADVLGALQTGINGPVIIDGVQIEDISFSKSYLAAIEAKQQATVEVQKREQELAQQQVAAQITVTNAQAAADAQVASAKAQAQATELAGAAEAGAIKAKGDALRENPALVDLTKAERWNGVLPTTMVPGSAVPFIDVGPQPAG